MFSALRIAWQGVRGFPLRNILTALSLIVGLVGLVAVFAAATTVRDAVSQTAIRVGGPEGTYSVTGPAGVAMLDQTGPVLSRLVDDGRASEASASIAISDLSLRGLDRQIDHASLRLMSTRVLKLHQFGIVQGKLDLGGAALVPAIAVNTQTAEQTGAQVGRSAQIALGDTVRNARIVAIVEDGQEEARAYASIDNADLAAQLGDQAQWSYEVVAPGTTAEELGAELTRRATLAGITGAWSAQESSSLDRVRGAVAASQTGFVLVGVLGMISAILGIANVGLSALRQRSSEMALRRALGAKRGQLLLIGLLESLIVAVLASIVAIPLSMVVFGFIVASLGSQFGVGAVEYPWPIAIVAVALGCAGAMVGGVAPAIGGARVSMTRVVRE